MYIAEITERLLEVNRLLLKYIKDTELTFEENLVFSGFYHDYKDINSIINSAEKELNDSPAILMEQAKALSAAASDFLATYESHEDIFGSYNPQPVCDRHIKYNPQIQISAESETKRSIFREKDKTKRSKKESAQHSKSRNKSFVMTSVSAL